jgi:hypothetical protein
LRVWNYEWTEEDERVFQQKIRDGSAYVEIPDEELLF